MGVSCERERRNGSETVVVRVRDTGAGIPPERIENIWEPYVTSKPGGTGLGLAIARQTILAHHGSVAAESTPGSGTEIRLTLPVQESRIPEEPNSRLTTSRSTERYDQGGS